MDFFKKQKHVAHNYLNWKLIKVTYRRCLLLFYWLVYYNTKRVPCLKNKYGFRPTFALAQGGPKKKIVAEGRLSFGLHGSGTIAIVHDEGSNFHPQTRLNLQTGRTRRTQSSLISTTWNTLTQGCPIRDRSGCGLPPFGHVSKFYVCTINLRCLG